MRIEKLLKKDEELTIGEFYKRVFGESGTPFNYTDFCVECRLNKKLEVEYKTITRGSVVQECFIVKRKKIKNF